MAEVCMWACRNFECFSTPFSKWNKNVDILVNYSVCFIWVVGMSCEIVSRQWSWNCTNRSLWYCSLCSVLFWNVSAFAGEILCNKNRYLKCEWFLKISNVFLYARNISSLHISNRVCELRLKEVKRQFWLTHCFIFNHLGYSVD